MQLLVQISIGNGSDLAKIEGHITAMKNWLSAYVLLLSSAETEMLVTGKTDSQSLITLIHWIKNSVCLLHLRWITAMLYCQDRLRRGLEACS